MAEAAVAEIKETDVEPGISRVYEVGYLVSPSVKEEDVEKVVAEVRKEIETQGGSFIAEGAPSMTRLAYQISGLEGGKYVDHDRASFGWIKFEAPVAAAQALEESLKRNASVIRHIVFRTVREETRAHLKAPQLREVRRTDTIKTTPKRAAETAAPVSEADLDKALEDLTAE
ncbi:MAG TPA: 30S ribosomal protein S6 [Candidatus Paceibacterota bacterium]|jgi:ribosomal protein S6|nr:30S ribosomal protein S6 [Candidatus Paceibacterota bacterium]